MGGGITSGVTYLGIEVGSSVPPGRAAKAVERVVSVNSTAMADVKILYPVFFMSFFLSR
jgi:hypothetical protein